MPQVLNPADLASLRVEFDINAMKLKDLLKMSAQPPARLPTSASAGSKVSWYGVLLTVRPALPVMPYKGPNSEPR